MPDFVAFTSYGNDSIALIQLLHEYRLPQQRHVCLLFSDTGWTGDGWPERVESAEAWARSKGFDTHRTVSVGFADLCRKRNSFPMYGRQFCTTELKIVPAQKWLQENDPDAKAICLNGVRRAESKRRASAPVFTPISDAHGGRPLWSPLAEFSNEDRDALIIRAGFTPLPHRSMECSPCIFANRGDLRSVSKAKQDEIQSLEDELGQTMFRPKGYAGAKGISEVMRWAHSDRGQYTPPDDDEIDCDSGFCGA